MKQIDVFDSTLRDGAQGEGISFSVQDKLNIVRALDELGVAFIEAGNPGSNPKDLEFFEEVKKLKLENSRHVRLRLDAPEGRCRWRGREHPFSSIRRHRVRGDLRQELGFSRLRNSSCHG